MTDTWSSSTEDTICMEPFEALVFDAGILKERFD